VEVGAALSPEEAIAFLERHQPMPPDGQLTEELIGTYDDAWRALARSNDPRAAQLLLNSFGDGDGWGVYQLVDETLRSLPRQQVVEALSRSLESPFRSVRSWSMEMAMDFPDRRLVPKAVALLARGDLDERMFAAYFLSDIESHDGPTVAAMRHAIEREDDGEIQSVLRDWFSRNEPQASN
jgi:hypothetical protein